MKSYIPDSINKKVSNFKRENINILNEWKKLKSDAEKSLFNKYCLKDYKDECEPIYCTFYKTNECHYPAAVRELEKI